MPRSKHRTSRGGARECLQLRMRALPRRQPTETPITVRAGLPESAPRLHPARLPSAVSVRRSLYLVSDEQQAGRPQLATRIRSSPTESR